MDFIVSLLSSCGKCNILVVDHRLSKGTHSISIPKPMSALTVAQGFSDNDVKLHDVPMMFVLYHDIIFLSSFWNELFCL